MDTTLQVGQDCQLSQESNQDTVRVSLTLTVYSTTSLEWTEILRTVTQLEVDYLFLDRTRRMTLLLKNTQSAVKLCMTRTKKDILLLREIFGIDHLDVGVVCVDNNTIQCLNKQFRKQDKPTDILSFPFHEVRNR